MHNYRLTIEYNGLGFQGWQKQKHTDNTVQGNLEKAAEILLKTKINLTGAGRTDSGVSAINQTANFYSENKIDKNKFIRSINSILPSEITVKNINEAPLKFHSRYSAKRREYVYNVTGFKKSVSGEFYHKINFNPDLERINEFIEFIKQLENFYSFCRNKTDTQNFSCRIYEFKYRVFKSRKEIIFTISANRFLHSMVRALVGCALEIGRGKLEFEQLIKKISKGEKAKVHYLPANALFLKKIYY